MLHFLKKLDVTLLIVVFNLLLCDKVCASPAYPGVIKFRQPNGEVVNIRLYGDENVNYRRTEDDYSLLFDEQGYLVYAELDSVGDMVPSKIRVSDVKKRTSAEQMFLSSHAKRLSYSQRQVGEMEARKRTAWTTLPSVSYAAGNKAPVVGDRKVLVILVEFADKGFTKSNSDFQSLMNEPDFSENGACGSVNDYYRYASGDKLNLTAEVVGPYKLSRNMSYYGGNTYGNGSDANPRAMASEALAWADADVDFSQFDADNNGTIDGVHIIYAGYGEEAGGGSNCIWAHKWNVYGNYDGMSISDYSCVPELRGNSGSRMTHIGVICHELGHVLGCWDFYDTDYATGGQYQGTGDWDIMASGNWNGDGATPANFNPYVRCYDFGWETPIELDMPSTITIDPGEQTVYRMSTQVDGEYFLLENRQQTEFDRNIPGHGLMVYKVKTDAYNVPIGSSSNKINATYPQNMYPLSANSEFYLPTPTPNSYGSVNSALCAYPEGLKKTELSDETTPSCRASNGLYTDKSIENITETNGRVTFAFSGGSGNPVNFEITDITTTSIKLSWKSHIDKRKVMLVGSSQRIDVSPESKLYNVGDVLSDGQTVVLYVGTEENFTHSNLNENSTYYYKIYTCLEENPVEWSKGAGLYAHTWDSNKPQYAFMENFDAFDWQQELLQGEYYWKQGMDVLSPGGTYGTASWRVIGGSGNPDGFEVHSSILTTPAIDLSRAKYATLTFDYNIGKYERLLIYYRLSQADEWILLESYARRTDGWNKAVVKLPALSSTLQIGFSANHNIEFGHTLNRTEAFIHVDNVGVAAKFKAMPVTLKPVSYGNTTAMIPVTLLQGEEEVTEYGVELDVETQPCRYARTSSDTVRIRGLKSGTLYTYRSYAVTASGVVYGDDAVFRTVTWQEGDGTADNPFIVDSEEDLALLSSEVAAGQDFKNCYFKMSKDITMLQPFVAIGDYEYKYFNPVHAFNGVFDGNGKTIYDLKLQVTGNNNTIACHCGLFGMIGEEGVVKHLNVEFDKITNLMSSAHIGIIASNNMGAIVDCHVYGNKLSNTIEDRYSGYSGGIAAQNYGYIVSCCNKVDIEGCGHIGGIVGDNVATIMNCANYGNVINYGDVNGSAAAGGIAGGYSSSYTPNGNERGYLALIANCENYGNVVGTLESGILFRLYIGGIAGLAKCKIEECVNYGSVQTTGPGELNLLDAGGIVGGFNGSSIKNCYNQGGIKIHSCIKDDDIGITGGIGGICGTCEALTMIGCCNTGKIQADNMPNVAPLAPVCRLSVLEPIYSEVCSRNNYYLENVGEQDKKYGTQFSLNSVENVVNELNANLHSRAWSVTAQGNIALDVMSDKILHVDIPVFTNSTGYILPVIYECEEDAELEVVEMCASKQDALSMSFHLEKGREYSFMSIKGLKPGGLYNVRIKTPSATSAWRETATLFDGVGSTKMPFEINSLQNLKALSVLVNSGMLGKHYTFRQTASIDLQCDSANSWIPVGVGCSFSGTYDGGGHELTNLYVDDNYVNAGLFAYFSGSVRNLSLVGNNVVNAPHSQYAGGIIARAEGVDDEYQIDKCLFHGKVIGGQYVGGISGKAAMGLSKCGAVVELYGDSLVGGITAAFGADAIQNSYAVVKPIRNCNVSAIAPKASWSHNVKNIYFLKNDSLDTELGTALSQEEMTSDVLISNLSGWSVWMQDVEPYKNEGYPIFRSNSNTPPTVITKAAQVSEEGKLTLNGTCLSGASKPDKTGFEIRLDRQTSTLEYEEIENENNSVIDIRSVVDFDVETDNRYLYRAFADINGQRYYGEEIEVVTMASDDVTSIKDVTDDSDDVAVYADNGSLVIVSDKDMNVPLYNVQGYLVQVLSVKTGHNVYANLQPGLYIINGKKYLIK